MKKTYVLYNEVDVEGELVDCIYLNYDECRAQPYIAKKIGRPEDMTFYNPSKEDKEKYCQVAGQFKDCPRFVAYQNHLRAIGLQK